MTNLAMEMALEFKRLKELEIENEKAGDLSSAERYMLRKWAVSREAEKEGVKKEFSAALKEIGVY